MDELVDTVDESKAFEFVRYQPLVVIEMNAGSLDGQSLIELNNLASAYMVPVYRVGELGE